MSARKAFLPVLIISLLITSFAIKSQSASASDNDKDNSQRILNKIEYAPDQVLIQFDQDYQSLSSNKTIELDNLQFSSIKELSDNSVLVRIPTGESVEDVVSSLSKRKEVAHVQPNFKYQIDAIPTNDPFRGELWGLDNTGQTVSSDPGVSDADIDAPEAWAAAGTLSEVIVAVLDTGIAYNHPDLDDALWDGSSCVDQDGVSVPGGCIHGYDFTGGYDNDPLSSGNDHGTHVAGTIAAESNNATGIVGAAPNVKVMALKSDLYTSEIVDAISFAENNGAKVINASWGASWTTCGALDDELMYNAIAGFDGLFITSAGNNTAEHDLSTFFGIPGDFGATTSCWAALDNVISVAATTNDDELAAFSDYGVNAVDIGAPGQTIFSSSISNDFVEFEDFETVTPPSFPAGWTKSGNSGVVDLGGAWTGTAMGDTNRFPYDDNASYTFTTPTYDLSAFDSAVIGFWLRCDTEYASGHDYITMEFSEDGSVFGQPISWFEGFIDDDVDPSGYAYDFIELSLPSNYLTANFKAQYTWTSDGDNNSFEGCGVDDFEINGYYDSSTDDVYTYKDGTSMAAPHVAAVAAMYWGKQISFTSGQVKTVLLDGAESAPDLTGKITASRRLNALNTMGEVAPAPITTIAEPATVAFDGKLYQSIRGADNKIYNRSKNSVVDNWSAWVYEGGSTLSGPALAVYNNVLFQSVRAMDNVIYYRTKTSVDGGWSSWQTAGGSTSGVPSMVAFDGRLYQSIRALDNTIYLRYKTSVYGAWSGWSAEGGSTTSGPALAVYNNVLFQSVRALDNVIYYRTKNSATAGWSGWQTSGGSTSGIPSMVAFDGKLFQSLRALDGSIYVRYKSSVSGPWSTWAAEGGSTPSSPSLSVYNNVLFQSVRALDNTVYYRTKSSSTSGWSSWRQ